MRVAWHHLSFLPGSILWAAAQDGGTQAEVRDLAELKRLRWLVGEAGIRGAEDQNTRRKSTKICRGVHLSVELNIKLYMGRVRLQGQAGPFLAKE